jgi:hypothetical protein
MEEDAYAQCSARPRQYQARSIGNAVFRVEDSLGSKPIVIGLPKASLLDRRKISTQRRAAREL